MAIALETCYHEDICCVIWFLREKKTCSPHQNSPLIEVYDNGVMRVQNIIQWCKGFENGQMDIHDDDCTR
jgi:hypothetical protein